MQIDMSTLVGRFTLSGGPFGPYTLKPIHEGGAYAIVISKYEKNTIRVAAQKWGETVHLKLRLQSDFIKIYISDYSRVSARWRNHDCCKGNAFLRGGRVQSWIFA